MGNMQKSVDNFHNPAKPNSRQFVDIFEDLYKGPGIDGVPWLSCLGNHDYGGNSFNLAWDQQFAYTWGPSGRWVMPGHYYHQHIMYPTKDMSVDVYVVDSNNQDTSDPADDPEHNLCSAAHNGQSNCAPFGPSSAYDCVNWFRKLWEIQLAWLDKMLGKSKADWQVILTHFPPETWTHYGKNVDDWKKLGYKYGIDLLVTAHRHQQELRPYGDIMVKFRAQIPYVVSGGGGGITSQGYPTNGRGSGSLQYGFFDMTVTKDKLFIQGYNHQGMETSHMEVIKRHRQCSKSDGSGPSSFYPCGCGIASNGVPNTCENTEWCSVVGHGKWGYHGHHLFCTPAPTPAAVAHATPELNKLQSNAPTRTFYMYRAQSAEDYPPLNVNMATLGGVLWYLHNEVVNQCDDNRGHGTGSFGYRRFRIVRILRYKVTTKTTQKLYLADMNFGARVAYDREECLGRWGRALAC